MSASFPATEELAAGKFCGVFIDDTGTPGQMSESPYLHVSRKTWVALILSSSELATVYREFPGVMEELRSRIGVSEFHAADLLKGKGALRSVPLATRFSVFEFLAHIFAEYSFPLIVQTASERTIADHLSTFEQLGAIGPFDFTAPADAGLLMLIHAAKQHLRAAKATYSNPCVLAIDEGRVAAGAFVPIAKLADFAVHSGAFFRDSASTFPIQLVDFAAFALNRTQWLLAKASRSDREMAELEIFDRARFNWLNLPRVQVDLATWQGENFDRFHEHDRLAKGLTVQPARLDAPSRPLPNER